MSETTWQALNSGTIAKDEHLHGPGGWTMPSLSLGRLNKLPKTILHDFSVLLHWFEVGLAGLSVVFVALGAVYLLQELGHFDLDLVKYGLHTQFEGLLADILLLVVGIELAIMLVRRTPESLIEVMFFVIARKMLIKTGAIHELLIGVAALAGLFAIRKYLEHAAPISQLSGGREMRLAD